jgi:hypothetical protein
MEQKKMEMQNCDTTNPWWPLIYLRAFDEKNNSNGVEASALAAMRDQVNGVLQAVNNNSEAAQNQALLMAVQQIGTLLQQGNFQISEKICECCCKLSSDICDVKTTTQMGFAEVNNGICQQTQILSAQASNNARDIIDAVREEGGKTREQALGFVINEKDEKINNCERQLSEQRIINEVNQKCSESSCNGGQSDLVQLLSILLPLLQNSPGNSGN